MFEIVDVTATQFRRKLWRWLDEASRRPVRITRDGRPRLVLLSGAEFDRLKRRDRIAIRAEDLSEAQVAVLEAAQAPEESKQYDWEFDPPFRS